MDAAKQKDIYRTAKSSEDQGGKFSSGCGCEGEEMTF